jgi:superfamily II DNA helicase RecQ
MRHLRHRLDAVAYWSQHRASLWSVIGFSLSEPNNRAQFDVFQGIDFPDVKIVCTAGLPSTIVNVLQRGGRALRNSQEDVLFIILYEPWVHSISLDEYAEGDPGDPDCLRAKLKSSSQQHEYAPFSCLKLVKSTTCLRSQFASYLGDTSPTGILNWYDL